MIAQINLDALIDEAARLLQARSAGESVCALAKVGTPFPAAKYAEGRWAALREVQRAIRSGVELASAAEAAELAWREHLRALQAREAGQDWIAYRSGGIDALVDLNTEMGAVSPPCGA